MNNENKIKVNTYGINFGDGYGEIFQETNFSNNLKPFVETIQITKDNHTKSALRELGYIYFSKEDIKDIEEEYHYLCEGSYDLYFYKEILEKILSKGEVKERWNEKRKINRNIIKSW